MVVCLFSTPENGVLIQDSFAMSQIHNKIIGMDTPYFYFMKKVNACKFNCRYWIYSYINVISSE